MTEMKSQIEEAFLMLDRHQNEAALKLIDEILAHLSPPDRIGDIPPARLTIYDWLWKAKRGLSGEPELVPPKAALRSALALVH